MGLHIGMGTLPAAVCIRAHECRACGRERRLVMYQGSKKYLLRSRRRVIASVGKPTCSASSFWQGSQIALACLEQLQVMEFHGVLQLKLVHTQRSILCVVDKVLGCLRVWRISFQTPRGLAKCLREQVLHSQIAHHSPVSRLLVPTCMYIPSL